MMRIVAASVLALAVLAWPVASARGHEITPGANEGSLIADGVVRYRYGGFSSGSALAKVVDESMKSKFHHPDWNNSRVPTLAYSSSGSARVIYSNSSGSPCTGNTAWLQCADQTGSASWRIYLRNFAASGRPTWRWDELGDCSGSTCWYMKRGLIHELGHAMVTFPDLCRNGYACYDEDDSVMNGTSPPIGADGGNHFVFRRCDQAALQLEWDLDEFDGPYSNCFDHLTSHGGLVTELSVSGSTSSRCIALPASISGRLQIKDTTATGSGTGTYGPMAKNPLAGRTVRILRKPFSSSDWAAFAALTTTANSTSSGNNWSRALPAPGGAGTWNYRAYYDGAAGEDLLADGPVSFNITWTTSCPT